MSLEKRGLPFFLPCFAALRYDFLVDVLQRVGEHPANRVHDLSPPGSGKNSSRQIHSAPLCTFGRRGQERSVINGYCGSTL